MVSLRCQGQLLLIIILISGGATAVQRLLLIGQLFVLRQDNFGDDSTSKLCS